MTKLDRLLASIGKASFVENYYEFKKIYTKGMHLLDDKKKLAEKLLQNNPEAESLNGQVTRINCAIRIFNEKQHINALENIVESRVSQSTKRKAIELILKENGQ